MDSRTQPIRTLSGGSFFSTRQENEIDTINNLLHSLLHDLENRDADGLDDIRKDIYEHLINIDFKVFGKGSTAAELKLIVKYKMGQLDALFNQLDELGLDGAETDEINRVLHSKICQNTDASLNSDEIISYIAKIIHELQISIPVPVLQPL